MYPRSPRTVIAGLALLPLLALTVSCGGEDPPVADPIAPTSDSSPPSETPTDTPSTEETTAPPEDETPQEFIRRWQETVSSMQITGDTKPFREMFTACRSCSDFAQGVEKIYRRGGSIETDGYTVLRIRGSGGNRDFRQFDVAIMSAPTTYRDTESSDTRTLKGGKEELQVVLQRDGETWKISSYLRVPA